MSKIDYCSSIWSNTSEGNIEKMQLVQNYAARIISGEKKSDHIPPTISALGWLPIKEHLLYRDILLMFKCVISSKCDKFKQRNQVHHRDTRSNEDLDIPKFRTCFLFYFFLFNFATRAGTPQQREPITLGPYHLTYPVYFPCGRKPECLEETHDIWQSVDFYSFHMRTELESHSEILSPKPLYWNF